ASLTADKPNPPARYARDPLVRGSEGVADVADEGVVAEVAADEVGLALAVVDGEGDVHPAAHLPEGPEADPAHDFLMARAGADRSALELVEGLVVAERAQ